jgi:hypothetical protein
VTDRDREGIETGRLEVLAAWVFTRNSGMNPRITPPPLWAVAKATRKTVLKVRYLGLTVSMGSKGNPMRALSTTERSYKVMFRVMDEIATCQSEPQDPSRRRAVDIAERYPFTGWIENFLSEKRKFKKSRNWGRVGETGKNLCFPHQSRKTDHLLS